MPDTLTVAGLLMTQCKNLSAPMARAFFTGCCKVIGTLQSTGLRTYIAKVFTNYYISWVFPSPLYTDCQRIIVLKYWITRQNIFQATIGFQPPSDQQPPKSAYPKSLQYLLHAFVSCSLCWNPDHPFIPLWVFCSGTSQQKLNRHLGITTQFYGALISSLFVSNQLLPIG